ncbi:MAG: aspartate--tRNA ligase, partial [Lachnospiraceae bacterium]|nr:aspartate--tRNA ligase [Lachnospiraceae bacterium]
MQSRTHTCGELREQDAGKEVKLCGWFENLRRVSKNLGFLVLRDFYGKTQIVIETEEMMEKISSVNKESTLAVSGTVRVRSSKNSEMATGDIEVVPDSIDILGKCDHESLPFEICSSKDADENTRLKYRYLDLRNPEVKDKMVLRSRIVAELRKRMTDQGFMEITTPILTCSSPEGARDYLVPSRNHPGKFYALPQAPQQFKQILMAGGFDRYFQIAPCFRDEDARADRSPGEFYQLDMEMAFASQEDVFTVIENVIPPVFSSYGLYKTASKVPFRRIPFLESLEKYGTDKPDLRIDLVVQDVTEVLKGCGFGPFDSADCIKAVKTDGYSGSRKVTDKMCADIEVESGGKTYWAKLQADGTFAGGVAKFLNEDPGKLVSELELKADDFVMFSAGDKRSAVKSAGVMRRMLGMASEGHFDKERYEFCWIVDFPMYEIGEESGQIEFCHNPFSMPQGGLEALNGSDPLTVLAWQYDLVCNGVELSSGAVRNHDPEIMIKAFEIAGLDEESVKSRFPAMYNAFTYGAPPHAG